MAEMFGALKLAQTFHEVYEKMAPHFGYETRKESAVPWEDVPENNQKLMIAVAARIMITLFLPELQQERERVENLADALKRIANHPHNMYDKVANPPYGIGVADGHRCAAKIAKAALKEPGGDAERDAE